MDFTEVFASELALKAFALGTGYAVVLYLIGISASLSIEAFAKMWRWIFDLIRSRRK